MQCPRDGTATMSDRPKLLHARPGQTRPSRILAVRSSTVRTSCTARPGRASHAMATSGMSCTRSRGSLRQSHRAIRRYESARHRGCRRDGRGPGLGGREDSHVHGQRPGRVPGLGKRIPAEPHGSARQRCGTPAPSPRRSASGCRYYAATVTTRCWPGWLAAAHPIAVSCRVPDDERSRSPERRVSSSIQTVLPSAA